MHPLLKLFRYAKGYRSDVCVATFYSLMNKIFDIFPEILIGVAVDVVVKQHDSMLAKLGIHDVVTQVVALGLFTGFIWILESTFQYLYSLKWCYLAQHLQHDMRMDAYNHVQNLQLNYFEDKATGNLMSILNDDINQLERFINDGVNQIIQVVSSTFIISIIFFVISAKVAVLSFLPMPFIILGVFFFRKHLAPRYLRVRNAAGSLNAKLNTNLSGVSTIKSFTTEEYEYNSLSNYSTEYVDANKKAILLSAAATPIIRIIIMLGFLVSLIYGGILTVDKQIEVASYSILIFLSQRLLWPLNQLGQVTDMYQRSMASINRVMGLLSSKIEIKEGTHQLQKPCRGDIEFKNVEFAYSGRTALFNSINVSIISGETVAFVGSTGSGKSTLVKLLLRLYDNQAGQITIDEHDIKDLTFKALRGEIGLVSQETFLIDGTIADNIAYGSFDVTKLEIERVAKLVEADEFINCLPDKYNTLVGERGMKLSGGQRQRIALARAIIKNPAILILDEATSALDNHTEDLIQKSMLEVAKGRTTIVIAHRLSTIVNADKIYVLDNGRVIEYGTHKKLISDNKHYAYLWNLQLKSSV
ncbi:MAG: ABC transporter ATP-binding protein [Burkholderiales bacterium]|nr:ABC transporter ATP-binding protein [Burkholderiales bacterium]